MNITRIDADPAATLIDRSPRVIGDFGELGAF